MERASETYNMNYFGGAIFWLYIVAALSSTTVVLQTIAQLRARNNDDQRQIQQGRVRAFSTLAALSFVMLSFNMLSVLIQSYISWSQQHSISKHDHSFLVSIWTWSMTSKLFRDFGEAIVANQARYMWTQSALLSTMSVSLYMSSEGPRRQIPKLWAFFAVGQILPISFAQNLFYLAVLQSKDVEAFVAMPLWLSVVTLYFYSVGLSIAPMTANGPWLIPLILAARTLLVVPLVLSDQRHHTSGQLNTRTTQQLLVGVSMVLTARQVYLALRHHTFEDIVKAQTSHPAVSALGVDFGISALSFAIWMLPSAVLETVQDKDEKHTGTERRTER